MSLDEVIKIANVFRKEMTDPKNIFGTGTILTNNEIKNIMEVIKSLENIGILLKGTIRKIISQEGGFSIFLSH